MNVCLLDGITTDLIEVYSWRRRSGRKATPQDGSLQTASLSVCARALLCAAVLTLKDYLA